jgi:hypothetical protein
MPTLPSRAVTQTLLCSRPFAEDDSEDDVQGKKDNRRRIERPRVPQFGMPEICSADIARCIALLI